MKMCFIYLLLFIIGISFSYIYFLISRFFMNSLDTSINNANLIDITIIFIYIILILPTILVILKKIKEALYKKRNISFNYLSLPFDGFIYI